MSAVSLDQLPVEVIILIVQDLSLTDILNLMLTCKTFNNIINGNNSIWRNICRQRFIVLGHVKKKNVDLSWYDQCRISNNWCKGIFKNKGLVFHNTRYMPWMEFHNSEVLLLTVGSEIRCYPTDRNGFPNCRRNNWCVSMPKIPRFDKRTDDISRFVLKDNLLVCGNRNGSSAVYKVDNLLHKPKLVQYIKNTHEDGTVEVTAVDVVNNDVKSLMITASLNSTRVHMWLWGGEDDFSRDLSLGGEDIAHLYPSLDLAEIVGGCYGVKCVGLNQVGDKLLLGPDGHSRPVLVDLHRWEVTAFGVDDPRQIVQDVQWHDQNTFCYVTHAGDLQAIDTRGGNVVYETRDPFQASFYCLKTDGHHAVIVGTNQHSRCVLFDIRKPNHTQLFFTQQKRKDSPVYSLDFDSTKLIAAVDWGVSALDFNVPQHTASKDYSHIYELFAA